MNQLTREIQEQPAVIRRLLKAERDAAQGVAEAIRVRHIQHVFIAARGTSDNAARYGKYLFSALNRLPVALAAPSLFTLYQTPPCLEGALAIGISQSGRSTDIVEVLREARRQDACTLAITNDADSPLAQTAEHVILCHAGEERSVAATKTYTAQLTALALLAAAMAGDDRRLEALGTVSQAVEAALALEDQIRRAVERYRHLIAELYGRGADLIVISDWKEAAALSQTACLLPVAVEEWLSPLISVIPGQLFALYLALTKGIDPDHPRGLSKVTLTQ
jgi:glucosamine--fructose-6-phosphate aminotransferase (isomerizing)